VRRRGDSREGQAGPSALLRPSFLNQLTATGGTSRGGLLEIEEKKKNGSPAGNNLPYKTCVDTKKGWEGGLRERGEAISGAEATELGAVRGSQRDKPLQLTDVSKMKKVGGDIRVPFDGFHGEWGHEDTSEGNNYESPAVRLGDLGNGPLRNSPDEAIASRETKTPPGSKEYHDSRVPYSRKKLLEPIRP